jgi:hypothetical protein
MMRLSFSSRRCEEYWRGMDGWMVVVVVVVGLGVWK